MSKSISCILILSLVMAFMLAGCAAPADTSSPPPDEGTETVKNPQEETPGRELVFDADGKVIEDENGHVDGIAAIDNMDSFTLDEVIKLIPYSDGALATAVNVSLGKRLIADFDNVISKLAASEDTMPEERLETKNSVYYGIGIELSWNVEGRSLTKEDCQILYDSHEELPQREKDILKWIKAGYEQIPYDQVK